MCYILCFTLITPHTSVHTSRRCPFVATLKSMIQGTFSCFLWNTVLLQWQWENVMAYCVEDQMRHLVQKIKQLLSSVPVFFYKSLIFVNLLICQLFLGQCDTLFHLHNYGEKTQMLGCWRNKKSVSFFCVTFALRPGMGVVHLSMTRPAPEFIRFPHVLSCPIMSFPAPLLFHPAVFSGQVFGQTTVRDAERKRQHSMLDWVWLPWRSKAHPSNLSNLLTRDFGPWSVHRGLWLVNIMWFVSNIAKIAS
jgi:hypothetical protein